MKPKVLVLPPIISRMFEPIAILTVIAFVGSIKAGLDRSALVAFALFLVVSMVIPVVLFLRWKRTVRGITWDLPDRHRRIKPLLVLTLLLGANTLFISFWHNTTLTMIFLVFLVWIVGFTLITIGWKISGHCGGVALASGLLIRWFGASWWPVLLAVPLVGWARVAGKNHTVAQVVVGALYSWFLVWILWR
jgi:membrane-associated phospholipid phosphatase